MQCLFAGNAYFRIHKYSRTSRKQTPKIWKLFDVAYIGKLSLYSLHFLNPSQSEVTERACMLRLIQESQNRLKFEIENNEKKKLYQINAVEP